MVRVKSFRLSLEEELTLEAEMKKNGETNFSTFARKKLLSGTMKEQDEKLLNKIAEKIHQKIIAEKLENIYLQLHELTAIAQKNNEVGVAGYNQVMTCFRDLLFEADNKIGLSNDFKTKWM